MPLKSGNSEKTISKNISEMSKTHPHKQAVAAALENARRHPHMANGGTVDKDKMSDEDYYHAQSDQQAQDDEDQSAQKKQKMARGGKLGVMKPLKLHNHAPGMGHVSHFGGLFNSDVPGRTDKIHVKVAPNSYVIPSDVVSGLGQGNSSAGAKVLDGIIGGGTGLHPPTGKMNAFASGGIAKEIPIIVAGGEYHVMPNSVAKLGGGSIRAGHQILDKFVEHIRKKTIKEMKNLPGPK